MAFGGINYLAVLVAAVAAFMFGALWYGALLSKAWMKAARIDPSNNGMNPVVMVMTFVGELVLAVGLAGIIGHLGVGQVTMTNGLISGFFVWLTVIFATMLVNHRNLGFGWDLTLIDGLHWLGAALIMGGVIGWMGA